MDLAGPVGSANVRDEIGATKNERNGCRLCGDLATWGLGMTNNKCSASKLAPDWNHHVHGQVLRERVNILKF